MRQFEKTKRETARRPGRFEIPGVPCTLQLYFVNVIVNHLSPPSAIGPLPPRLGLGSKFPRVEHAHRGGVDGALARAMARARVG